MNTPMELTNCPTCGLKLSDGMFSSNKLIDKGTALLIKEYVRDAKDTYCSKCHSAPFNEAKFECGNELRLLNARIKDLINNILIVSVHSPLSWDYQVLDIVTGQSTTGTGFISEFTSSITDFFGAQSGAYNKKIAHGEQLCQTQLRLKCLKAGGNAIIAADIDYAEVGGAQGMLMVCMTGTAIKLNNLSILGEMKASGLNQLNNSYIRKEYLDSIAPKDAYQPAQNNHYMPR